MKKQLLSSIAIGLMLAAVSYPVAAADVAITQEQVNAVIAAQQANAEVAYWTEKLNSAQNDTYIFTSREDDIKAATEGLQKAQEKQKTTNAAISGMDSFTLNQVTKVAQDQLAKNAASAGVKEAQDDWYFLTSREKAENAAKAVEKQADQQLANTTASANTALNLKAAADTAVAATTEEGTRQRAEEITQKMNQERLNEIQAQQEAEKKAIAAAEQREADRVAAQAKLEGDAVSAQDAYNAAGYSEKIETATAEREALAAAEQNVANAEAAYEKLKTEGVYTCSGQFGTDCYMRKATAQELQAAEDKVTEAKGTLSAAQNSTAAVQEAARKEGVAISAQIAAEDAVLKAAGVEVKETSDLKYQKEALAEEQAELERIKSEGEKEYNALKKAADEACAGNNGGTTACADAKKAATDKKKELDKAIKDQENIVSMQRDNVVEAQNEAGYADALAQAKKKLEEDNDGLNTQIGILNNSNKGLEQDKANFKAEKEAELASACRDGDFTQVCQEAKQRVEKEIADYNAKIDNEIALNNKALAEAKQNLADNTAALNNLKTAEQNVSTAQQNYSDVKSQQSSANSQAVIDQTTSAMAAAGAQVTQAQALASMRAGAFWDALSKVDNRGGSYVEDTYGTYQRAFDDTTTYAKELRGKAAANTSAAQATLTSTKNDLTAAQNTAAKANATAKAAVTAQINQKLADYNNQITQAKKEMVAAQTALAQDPTDIEALADLDAAKSMLETAESNKANLEKYPTAVSNLETAQKNADAADAKVAAAQKAATDAAKKVCAEGDTACKQNKADTLAAFKAAQDEQKAAQNAVTAAEKEVESAKTSAQSGMTDAEKTAFQAALNNQKSVADAQKDLVDKAQNRVDEAQTNADKAQSISKNIDKVIDGSLGGKDAEAALSDFSHNEAVKAAIASADAQAQADSIRAQQALTAHVQNQTRQEQEKLAAQQRENEAAAAARRQEILSGAIIGNTIRENVTNPLSEGIGSATSYVTGGIKEGVDSVTTGVGDAIMSIF